MDSLSQMKQDIEKMKRFRTFYTKELIESLGQARQKYVEAAKNEEYYEGYQNIVKKTAILTKELYGAHPVLISTLFNYLLWNGYLSKDKKLVYSVSNRINNIAVTGADIMRGRSVCLNNANMLTDVLNETGAEAYTLGCLLDINTQVNLEYKPDIERQIDPNVVMKDKILRKLIELTPLKRIGNHAITLIREDHTGFIVDPTNLCFYNSNGFLETKIIGSDKTAELKPFLTLLLNDIDEKSFREMFVDLFLVGGKGMDSTLAKNIYNKMLITAKANQSLLDDFHDDINDDIEKVSKTLKKAKIK